jgi:hypothetical protein
MDFVAAAVSLNINVRVEMVAWSWINISTLLQRKMWRL